MFLSISVPFLSLPNTRPRRSVHQSSILWRYKLEQCMSRFRAFRVHHHSLAVGMGIFKESGIIEYLENWNDLKLNMQTKLGQNQANFDSVEILKT